MRPVHRFLIPGLRCGHCVRAVTAAVQALDPQARVEADLPTHRVSVHSEAARPALEAALRAAGHPPAAAAG